MKKSYKVKTDYYSDETLDIILKALPELGLSLPLSIDDCDNANEYFTDIEVSLATGLSNGYKIDMDELDDAADAHDALNQVDCENEGWGEPAISLEEFNRRLIERQHRLQLMDDSDEKIV